MTAVRWARVTAAAAALAGALCLSSCAVVVLGPLGGRTPPGPDAGGAVPVVGAGDDEVDVVARNALADLERFWTQRFPDVFGQQFTPLQGGYFSVDPDEQLVAFDETDLAPGAYDLGDFALATGIAIPYSLAARDQLGLSTDDEAALRSALCLTGWYAAKVAHGEAGKDVLISPGDIDESVQFLLTYGRDPDVLPDVSLTGFQQVDLFRNGFLRGLPACDVGA